MLRGRETWATLLVVCVVVVGALLRILQLDQSVVGDEPWSYYAGTLPSFGDMLDFVRSDQEITPPLFTTLVWVVGKIGGDDPSVLRLTSLLAGILTIPLVYGIGLRVAKREVAVAAAALTALSPFLAYFSVELRAYSLVIMFVSASTLALLNAVERERVGWWVAYGALSCLAMYTHYTAAYVLAAQLLWVLVFHPAARRAALLSNAGAAAAFLPWVPALIDDLGSPTQGIITYLAPFNWQNGTDFLARFAVGNPGLTVGDFLGWAGQAALVAGFATAVVGLVLNHDRTRERVADRDKVVLVVVLALAAPVGVALVSLFGDDQFLSRNLGTSAPGLYLSMALLLAAGTSVTRVVSAVLVFGAFAWGGLSNLFVENQRAPYGAMSTYLEEIAKPGDLVLDASAISTVNSDTTSPISALEVALGPNTVLKSVNSELPTSALIQARGSRLFLVGDLNVIAVIADDLHVSQLPVADVRSFSGAPSLYVETLEIPAFGDGGG